ncbi:unnamed protein product [Paramecium sonneborni]|uniref:Uncharacterized protein n=1 Tax=Paramecium sonneborni TaxID=65129 RepID=A0A8S1JYE2_9CILI|nr:unnamed protein product [Paramecium sonneborni]
MNSSKTSRTVKAMHLFHLEQRNSNLQHYNIPTSREPIPSILKPFRLSPTKQSFSTSQKNLENCQSKLSVERKIQQLRKEILIAKNIKQKQLFQSNKQLIKNNFSTLEKQLDKQPKLIKYFEKKSHSKIKLFEIPITVQERQIQQSTLSTKVTKIPILKLQEKQTSTLEDGINENQVIQQYQSTIKLPSEPDSPQIIKKLQSYQFTQRSVSQGNVEKQKKVEWTPWPQNFEGWHAPEGDEDLQLQYQQFF